MACAVASIPRAALAADPGITLTVMNRTTEVASSVGRNAATRSAITRPMATAS
jgi:hypothetical protein